MGLAAETGLCKLAFGTADPVDFAMNFASFEPGVSLELRDTNASRGTFDKDGNRVVNPKQMVEPKFNSQPTAAELAYILEWATNGTPTGSTTKTYPLADTPAKRFIHFSPRVGDTFFLSGCSVDTLTLNCAMGEPLSVDLDILGMTWDDAHASIPNLSLDQTTRPFVLAQLVATIGGSSRNVRDFSFTLKNNLMRDRFFNSLTLTDTVMGDRELTVGFTVPSGANSGAWKLGLAAVSLSAVFTNAAGAVLTIATSDFRPEPKTPTFEQKAEGFIRMEGQLYRVSSGRPVTITYTAA